MVIGIYRHPQQCPGCTVTTRRIGGQSLGRYNELFREFHGLVFVYTSYLYK
jgi:hypothetical protein